MQCYRVREFIYYGNLYLMFFTTLALFCVAFVTQYFNPQS